MRRLVAALILACACDSAPSNPSGSCTASGSGARAGYHAPGDSQWMPDCQNPLRREYWRVFLNSARSAYTIPRLDGEPALQPACRDAGHALAPLVQRYGLCAAAENAQQVARVNDLAPADALALTHFLHQGLRFVAGGQGVGIVPFPIPSDIIDACALHPAMNSAALADICAREADRLRNGFDIALTYQGPGGVELAARLDELYGIK